MVTRITQQVVNPVAPDLALKMQSKNHHADTDFFYGQTRCHQLTTDRFEPLRNSRRS